MSKNNTLKKRIAVLEAEKKALISENESLSGIVREKMVGKIKIVDSNSTGISGILSFAEESILGPNERFAKEAPMSMIGEWLEKNRTIKAAQEKPLFVNSKGDKFFMGDVCFWYRKRLKDIKILECSITTNCGESIFGSEIFKTKQEAIDFGKRFEAEKWVGKTVFMKYEYMWMICEVDSIVLNSTGSCLSVHYDKRIKYGELIKGKNSSELNDMLTEIREATEEEKALLNPKPIVFRNSIGEEFTKEDLERGVYWVIKKNNTINSLPFVALADMGDNKWNSEIYKTRKGAEDYVAAHPLKVELVRGEWYQNKIGSYGRYNKGLKWFSFVCNNGSSPYVSIWNKATLEQIKQGEAEEIKAGKIWSKEKCDYLTLEDVCYEFDNIADLLDIDKIMPISTWRDQTNSSLIETRRDSHIIHDYSLHYKDGELRTTINVIYVDKKQSVTKETFLTLLKNHK